jgi:hypothetical protein
MPEDIEAFVAKKNALYGSKFALLVEIEYADGEFIRWAKTEDGADVTFDGSVYVAFPIGKIKRSHNSRGEIGIFNIPIANPQRIFQSTLQNYIIEGKTGRLITVDRDNLGDPTACQSEWFTIELADSVAETITLSCKNVRFNPLRSRIPRRTMTRSNYPGLMGSTRHRFY